MLYYRKPRNILIAQCVDPASGIEAKKEVTCEFKDDITELIIDEAASILAGDIESFNQSQRAKANAETTT